VQYTAGANPRSLVGSGGTFTARFRAVKPGKSKVVLGYSRPGKLAWRRCGYSK